LRKQQNTKRILNGKVWLPVKKKELVMKIDLQICVKAKSLINFKDNKSL